MTYNKKRETYVPFQTPHRAMLNISFVQDVLWSISGSQWQLFLFQCLAYKFPSREKKLNKLHINLQNIYTSGINESPML